MSWNVGRGLVVAVTILASTALAMVRPVGAGAATVAVEAAPVGPSTKVLYRAAPGEQNDVIVERVASAMYAVTISDSGAVLSAGASCEAVDAHTARCDTSSPPTVYAEFDDSNDRLRPSRDSGVVVANGGRGDDVLDLRSQGFASGTLDGGGGRDELYGGEFGGVLTDGDRDGAAGDAGPGPDVLNGGGSDYDSVSYQQRRKPISVDLASARPAGAAGEGDIIRAVESVIGGSGPDQLAGTDGPNALVGSGGADTLIGRGGDDNFGSSAASYGGLIPDPSVLAAAQGTRGDTVVCGRGVDRLWHPSSTTFIDSTCEWLFVSRTLPAAFPKRQREIDWALRAYPRRHGSSMTYSVDCSSPENDDNARWAALRCAETVTLRDTSRRRRLLATGTLPRGHLTLVAQLRFTPIGRRLAARRQGVRASLRVRGKNLPTGRWTIRLKFPR